VDRRIAPRTRIEEAIEAVLLDGISGPDQFPSGTMRRFGHGERRFLLGRLLVGTLLVLIVLAAAAGIAGGGTGFGGVGAASHDAVVLYTLTDSATGASLTYTDGSGLVQRPQVVPGPECLMVELILEDIVEDPARGHEPPDRLMLGRGEA
jgi:hypothetical protein